MNEERKLVTKKDIIILAVILVAACALLLSVKLGRGSAKTALISVDGRDYMKVPLENDDEITLENGVKIIVKDGSIGFCESDCPDKICIRTGMLSKSGEVAACVPNRTVISVEGGSNAVDAITY